MNGSDVNIHEMYKVLVTQSVAGNTTQSGFATQAVYEIGSMLIVERMTHVILQNYI